MVINLKSETDLSGFYILYKGSVKNERKGWYGLSHCMEHLLCHTFDDLLDDFDKDGIMNNAYTSDNEVVFYFTGLDEYLNKYKDKIIERILKFNVSEETFLNEKKIVLQEYKRYFNEQDSAHYFNLLRTSFNTYGPIGLKEDLENLTYQDCLDYFDLQFSKPHKIINVSKYSDYNTDIEFAEDKEDEIMVLGDYDNPIEEHSSKNGVASMLNVSNVVTEDFAKITFICDMLGSGLKSPLYQEIREKRGLVYSLRCSLSRLTDKCGTIMVSALSTTDNVEIYQNTLRDILNDPDKHMTKERFDIIKENIKIKIKKRNINKYSNPDTEIIPNEWLIDHIIDDLTYDDVMEIYDKYFKYENFYKSINE